MDHDPNLKGNVAELAIAAEAAKLGLSVLRPLTEHERYDLVLGVAGRLFKVQCKWATRNGEVIGVRLKSSWYSPTKGYVTNTYDSSEIDAIAVYCADPEGCYLIPIERAEGKTMLSLRLGSARNGQRAALNWASDYEFPGAVAQLAERVAGSDEVRGSIPLSSTHQVSVSEPEVERVGAHEFRNHFGYYLERAAGGGEVLISRRGRPCARLGPPLP
jgi:prevent-host-death family protein